MSNYVLKDLNNGDTHEFSTMHDACTRAANILATSHGLPLFKNDENRYSLSWDVILRDRTYSRIYKSSCGGFLIIAEEI